MLKVTDQDRADFDRDGVMCLRNVVEPDVVNSVRSFVADRVDLAGQTSTGYDLQAVHDQVWALKSAIDTGKANRFDMGAVPEMVHSDPSARPLVCDDAIKERGKFYYEAGLWRTSPVVRDAALYSELPRLVSDLIGAKELSFFEDTVFAREPRTPAITAMHQDLDFFNVGDAGRKVIAWLALDPCSPENGVTRYVRGSHKWGKTYAANLFFSTTPMPESEHERVPDIDANPDAYDIVEYEVSPGDVIIHDVMTVHGAGGNPTDRPRFAISFRYCDQDTRIFLRPGAIPQTGLTKPQSTGDRLAPADYPIAWSSHKALENVNV